MNVSNIIEQVTILENAGIACFPTKPDKTPIVAWGGVVSGTKDFRLALIQQHIDKKRPFLIAAVPGSGYVVVDIDDTAAYSEAVKDSPPDLGPVIYRTPSGGQQAWFTMPPDSGIVGVVNVGWGELRTGPGCYCIIPPGKAAYKKHDKFIRGEYVVPPGFEWLHEAIERGHVSPLPQRFLALGREKVMDTHEAESRGEVFLVKGGRDQGLMSIAGTLRARGLTVDAIRAALESFNATNVHPPMESADITRIARSAGRYDCDDPPPLAVSAAEASLGMATGASEPPPSEEKLISDTRLCSLTIPPPTVLWGTTDAPLLVAGEPHLLHAREGMGKSWLALGLAYEIAMGGPSFIGIPLDGQKHTVLLLSYELSRYAAQQRLRKIHDGRPPADNLHLVCEEHLAGRLDLMDASALVWLQDRIGELKPAVIFIDPLAQAAKNDESNKEFAILVERLAQLRLATHAALFLLHHERKGLPGSPDKGDTADLDAMRGGTVLRAGMRIVMRMVQRDDDYTEFSQTKSNLGNKWEKTILDMSDPWCPVIRPERPGRGDEIALRRKRLYACLAASGEEGLGKTALMGWGEAEGIAWRTVHVDLRYLVGRGFVEPRGGSKNTKYFANSQKSAEIMDME